MVGRNLPGNIFCHESETSMIYPEMRRSERKMDDQKSLQILQSAEYGVLSTVDSGGQPYGVPLNYVYHQGALYFHGAQVGHKLNNLQNESRISFCVVSRAEVVPQQLSTNFESVIVFGRAAIVEGKAKIQALRWLHERFVGPLTPAALADLQEQQEHTLVVKIVIEHMTGKERDNG